MVENEIMGAPKKMAENTWATKKTLLLSIILQVGL